MSLTPSWISDFVKRRLDAERDGASAKGRAWLDEAGGISLFGTIGTEAFLRPDGSVWYCDDDYTTGTYKWRRATAQEAAGAIKVALKRIPDLAPLLPSKTPGQPFCPVCNGTRDLTREGKVIGEGVLCDRCCGIGYLVADAA